MAETIRAKGLSRSKISKGFFFFFGGTLGSFLFPFFSNMFLRSCLFLPASTCGCVFLKQRRYHLSPPLIVIPDRLPSCQAAVLCVCHCYASTLSDLCCSFWLAWRRHETKSVTVVKGIFFFFGGLSSDLQKSLNSLSERHFSETRKTCFKRRSSY